MADRNTAFRAGRKLVEHIDAYARRVTKETGIDVTRAQAAVALVKLGLRQANAGRKR
jgi:hypothetical protein